MIVYSTFLIAFTGDDEKQLQLVDNMAITQISTTENQRFDLSGIVQVNKEIFVVADKKWNEYIYKIDTGKAPYKISDSIPVKVKKRLDCEGIDYANQHFYFVDEHNSRLFKYSLESKITSEIELPWGTLGENIEQWENAGLEGVAIDSINNKIFLVKERAPRKIFCYDLNTNQLEQVFEDLINQETGDFADAKYENNSLYLLERNTSLILKINTLTNQIDTVCYSHISFKNNKRLYENQFPQYGMAEALLITENEIWIGFDNNGDKVSETGKSFGLQAGDAPAIIRFKRPVGF